MSREGDGFQAQARIPAWNRFLPACSTRQRGSWRNTYETIMKHANLALTAALALAFSFSAQGESLPVFVGDDIVVTATRSPLAMNRALGDLTVIDARQIAESGQSTLLELLQSQPGIEITQQGGTGTVGSVRIRGGNSGHTLVLLDGLRAGSATTGATPVETIALEQIERIEILRGPASSLYGADAVSGVIQIFTKRGSGKPALSIKAGLGSAGLAEGALRYSGMTGMTRFSLGAGYARTDGGFSAARPGTFGYVSDEDGERRHSLHLNLDHALDSRHRIGLIGAHNYSRVEYDAGTASDYAKNQVNGLSAWWQGRLTGQWKSRFTAGLGQNLTENFGGSPGRFDTDQHQYQWQNDFLLPAGDLTFSLERLEEYVDASVAFSKTRRAVNAGQLGYRVEWGAHGIQASIRHDDYNDFGEHTTGMAAYAYRPTPAWRLSASYGTSFKAPTFNDLYWPATPFFVGNPNLNPERGRNLEFAVRYSEGVHQASLVAYRNRLKDLIVYVFPTMQNVNRASLDGVTLAGETRIGATRLKASLDWLNAEDEATGNTLTYRAPLHGTLDVSHQLGNWEFGAGLTASGYRYINAANTQKLPGYARLDARASYLIKPGLKVLARVNNLLDKDYQLVSGYNTPGLNGFFGLDYSGF